MTSTAPVSPDDIIQKEILQAALRLYKKFGPDKVTMDDVANASGRSRTSLYYYYKNRDEIFQAVMETVASQVADEIRLAVTAAPTLKDKIQAFCTAKVKTSEDWKPVFNAMWASLDKEEKSKHARYLDALHKKLIHLESIILNEILSAATRQKSIRPLNPGDQDMLVFIIATGIRGIRREVFDQKDPHDLVAAIRLLTDMVIKWLER
jgi:AcrR family transcriptional regulator